MKITTAKKVLLSLGLGLGLAMSSVSYANPDCAKFLWQCEYGDYPESNQGCRDFTKWCGDLP